MLEESLKTGLREGFIKKSELTRVNVDSTVQEKAVRYPTDARLYDRLRECAPPPAWTTFYWKIGVKAFELLRFSPTRGERPQP